MTDRISYTSSSPATTFTVEGDLYAQSVAGNYSVVRCYLRAMNGPGGSTGSFYGGAGYQAGHIDGVKEFARRSASSNFLPSGYANGATRWRMGPYDVQVPHNSDGTRAPIRFAMVLSGPANVTLFSSTISLPTIARATTGEIRIGSTTVTSLAVGTAATIYLPRASSSFTHTLQLWEYGVNATSPIDTLATGVGVSTSWTPALSLATYFPDATSKRFFLRTITYNGSSQVGVRDTVFTLTAPSTLVPTVSSINVSDNNPAVVSAIGGYVQGQSLLKATVVASGVQGSTITSRAFSVDGNTAPSGGTVALPLSGTRVVSAAVVDSRGRTAAGTANITVLAYQKPKINSFTAERANSSGTPANNGTYLRVTLNASVSSLVVGSQKNSMTIKISTRPRGSGVWTARNTITAALSYNTSVLVTGGSVFPTNTAFDVRVEVSDKLQKSEDYWAVSTMGAILDADGTKQALGKMIETSGPTTQIEGPARVYGDFMFDGTMTSGGIPWARLTGPLVNTAGDIDASALPGSYASGVTIHTAGSGWPSSLGTILNIRSSGYRQFQIFTDRTSPGRAWYRAANGDSAWQPFVEFMTGASAKGVVNCAASGVTTVTFPSGMFSSAPNIQATPVGNSVVGHAHIGDLTSTSMSVRFFSYNGNQEAGTVHWTATA